MRLRGDDMGQVGGMAKDEDGATGVDAGMRGGGPLGDVREPIGEGGET